MVFMRNLILGGVPAIVFIGLGREKSPPDELIRYFGRRPITPADAEGFPPLATTFIRVSSNALQKLSARPGTTLEEALKAAEFSPFKPIKLNRKGRIIAKCKSTKGSAANVAGLPEGSDAK